MKFNTFLHHLLSWRLRRPLAKQLARLKRQNRSVGERPTYSDCQDICAGTRHIWDRLHTDFSALQMRDRGEEPSLDSEKRPHFRDAKSVFSSSAEILARALESNRLSPEQEEHVRLMHHNICDRLEELEIALDETEPYVTRISRVYEKTRVRDSGFSGTGEKVPSTAFVSDGANI